MIRAATPNDLKEIMEIYNEAVQNTTSVYDYQIQSLAQREAWYREKIEGNYPVLVYEEEGRAAGFATFGPFRFRPAYQYSIEHSVYIHNDYRNKGIGRKLLFEIIDIADKRGYKILVAGIDEANEASIYLHKKMGFIHSGTIWKAGYKFNRWLNLCFYQYELSGPKHPVEE